MQHEVIANQLVSRNPKCVCVSYFLCLVRGEGERLLICGGVVPPVQLLRENDRLKQEMKKMNRGSEHDMLKQEMKKMSRGAEHDVDTRYLESE